VFYKVLLNRLQEFITGRIECWYCVVDRTKPQLSEQRGVASVAWYKPRVFLDLCPCIVVLDVEWKIYEENNFVHLFVA
jgi:hypothetical protein